MKHVLTLLGALALAGCISINSDVVVEDGQTSNSISTVNGSVDVGIGAIVDGDISTVNGSIAMARGSQAGDVATVNGKIELGPDVVAGSVETVNGAIQIAGQAAISGDVETVNGRVTLGEDTVVEGRVAAVNGQLLLRGAEVGSLVNVNGGMVLEPGSVVNGELRVRKPRGGDDEPVSIDIRSDVTVAGPLVFERPVTLRVHETARLGEIQGAEPEYYND
ncbi:hypothetical protein HFP89_13725 [Wenzhouxiangella sp. XN79A]|uniref:hypothetical protein n=1 Tax=Wenzhouxiangella sp. XN79A TaxID=2724193 RepID=UPI00144A984B|nr:hypothetical protein [Wenzhouxiangella sp. XN79A]NKI36224.1 hypothetical protein [Wenzhouxiangella sp. XN79A]